MLAQIRYPANKNASAYEASPVENSDRQLFFPVIKQRLGDGSATSVTIQNLIPHRFPAISTIKAACLMCWFR